MPLFRGVGSVIAGFILLNVLTMFGLLGLVSFWPEVTTAAAAGRTPPDAFIVAKLALSAFLALVSSFVTARLAPEPKMMWVLLYAFVVFGIGVVFAITASGGPEPTWYLVTLPMLGGLCIVAGGRWYLGRRTTEPRP
jgi:peptidoglycan/LPS O-acetylase OafA/YrhL